MQGPRQLTAETTDFELVCGQSAAVTRLDLLMARLMQTLNKR